MNITTVLHTKAMEFADEALLAKMEGQAEAATAFFEKAYALEKEAATSISEEKQKSESHYMLIRSAASLAMNCGKLQEAKTLINVALAGNPPAFIVEELKSLEETIGQLLSGKISLVEIVGVIIYANASESEIRLQDIQSKALYTIVVPRNLIDEIVKSYWADLVQVKAKQTPDGAIMLDQITRAA